VYIVSFRRYNSVSKNGDMYEGKFKVVKKVRILYRITFEMKVLKIENAKNKKSCLKFFSIV